MKFTIISNEDDDRPVFITGNFNKWNPKDATYVLKKHDNNTYTIEIDDEQINEKIE